MRTVAIAALAVLFSATAASAAPIVTTVTASGAYGNDLAVINDGDFPPDGYYFADPRAVYFGPSITASNPTFTFDFGGAFQIAGFAVSVDNNDDYTFAFYNGDTLVGADQIFTFQGNVSSGLERFNRDVGPFVATSVRVAGVNGDGFYSIGEVQINGSTVVGAGVPEPTSWALMILGFGAAGAAVRRRRSLVA